MAKNLTISLDAMGGDLGPAAVIPGAAMALEEKSNIEFLFFGDEAKIKPYMDQYPQLHGRAKIVHTSQSVSNEEKPSVALRSGRQSSMRLAIDSVKQGESQGIVSSGNTGALMAMAKMSLRCLPGIHRPAIASVFPTVKKDIVMLDLGANLSCDAENLVHFAVLGALFAKVVCGTNNPSVGILNVGSEEMKGHEQVRGAAAILNNVKFPGTFYGFVEGNDVPMGTTDVVVTDGFTGNVALKVAEGVGHMTSTFLKEAFMSSPLAKLGGLLAYGALKRMKQRMDPKYYNGGMFLGLNGICVKSHGSMDDYGFSRAVLVAADLIENGYNDRVADEISLLMEQESFVSVIASQAEGGV